jgi:hypothetical protein
MAHVAMASHLSCDAMCEVLIWRIMINSYMQCIVAMCQCVTHLLDIFITWSCKDPLLMP